MTVHLNNIAWCRKANKIIGVCDEGIVLTQVEEFKAIYINNKDIDFINNEDIYFGYIYYPNEFTTERGK